MIVDKKDGKYDMTMYCVAPPDNPEQDVGAFSLRIEPSSDMNGPSLWGVHVWPPFQGQGHGNMLMHDMLKEARNMGLESMSLQVDEDNDIAINMYKKHGFEISAHQLMYTHDKGLDEQGWAIVDAHMEHESTTDEWCGCSMCCDYHMELGDLCQETWDKIQPFMTECRYETHGYVMRREL